MACSEGLASDIEQALDMVPIQMLTCIQGGRRVRERGERGEPLSHQPVGSPQDFVAMAVGANVEGLEVIRAG